MQQSVFHGCAANFDEIRQLETAFKITPGNAAMQVFNTITAFFRVGAADDQDMFMDRHVQLIFAETGHGHGNPVDVVTVFFNIVRGPVGLVIKAASHHAVDQVGHAVKADGGPENRGQIKCIHRILLRSNARLTKPLFLPVWPGSDYQRHHGR